MNAGGESIRRSTGPMAALIGVAGLALLAAACGGSPGRAAAGPAEGSGAVAFARCMRSNGVPGFPDPASSGELPKVSLQQLGISRSRLDSAERACRHLLPASDVEASVTQCLSTGDCPPALLRQIMTGGLAFAHCMRVHGVPAFPDPIRDPGNGAPSFDLVALRGIDWNSTQMDEKLDECRHVYSGGVRVGLER